LKGEKMNYLSEKARNLIPYVAGLQPKDNGWIKLNTNENPYPPSPKVIEALKNADLESLRLYPDGNSGELRDAIAENLGVGIGNVFAGNSSDEVLALAFQAFFGGKKNVLMPDISYGFYPVWSAMYDVGMKIIPLGEDFTINPNDYKNSDGVIIANPNAPTGVALTLAEVEEIVKNNPNGVVLVDEAYIDFANVESAVVLNDNYENLLVARTFSKSYSLAGLRVGYAAGGKELIAGLQTIKNAYNSYPLGMLAQSGAKAAVRDVDYWNETRKRIIETRDKTAARLRKMGYNVLDSQTNFLFVEAENAKRAKELYEYLFANKILARYWDKPRINRFFRVSIGTDAEMEAFLNCIEKQTKPR
jgi:histidinol-phosphate aminotransferase